VDYYAFPDKQQQSEPVQQQPKPKPEPVLVPTLAFPELPVFDHAGIMPRSIAVPPPSASTPSAILMVPRWPNPLEPPRIMYGAGPPLVWFSDHYTTARWLRRLMLPMLTTKRLERDVVQMNGNAGYVLLKYNKHPPEFLNRLLKVLEEQQFARRNRAKRLHKGGQARL
jgi:hypothetical protein